MLDKSFDRQARLELGKATLPDAVPHPWESVVELPDQTQRLLPMNQSVAGVFEEFARALLILGGPGSGKTITLYELARDLIEKAENDRAHQIPVVFNLSTWNGETLFAWLVEQLTVWYLVPANQGRKWLRDGRLILLLDGLDEVTSERRADCVEAINLYVRDTRLGGLAVCSRVQEYTALPVRLTVNAAICLQPLTPSQVEQYLTTSGRHLDVLRVAIQLDDQLQTLAETPLMLNVMTLAYDNLSVEDLTDVHLDTVEERRTHLFTAYVTRMLKRRKGAVAAYGGERIVRRLSWLAQRMKQHNQSQFLIERLQPDWLGTPAQRWVYFLTSRLWCGAVLGFVLAAIFDILLRVILIASGSLYPEALDTPTRLGVGLLVGAVGGIVGGLMDGWRSRRTTTQPTMEIAAYVVVLILLGWLIVGFFDTLLTGLMLGLVIGLVFGLFFGIHGRRRGVSDDIRTVEALYWSWPGFRRSGLQGMVAGAGVGVIVGIVAGLVGTLLGDGSDPVDWLFAGLVAGIVGAVLGSVVGAAFGSLASRIITDKALPNQGVHLSARNAGLAAAITGVMIAALLWAVATPILSATQAAEMALIAGLFFGMLAGLRAGGFDVIQHYTLRGILAARGHTPLRYARFLDCAASLIFLQKAGGGYLFVHRLLLEYFAEYGGNALGSATTAAEEVPISVRHTSPTHSSPVA